MNSFDNFIYLFTLCNSFKRTYFVFCFVCFVYLSGLAFEDEEVSHVQLLGEVKSLAEQIVLITAVLNSKHILTDPVKWITSLTVTVLHVSNVPVPHVKSGFGGGIKTFPLVNKLKLSGTEFKARNASKLRGIPELVKSFPELPSKSPSNPWTRL